MKFKSYQAGGAIYTPFISNRGVSPQTAGTTSSTASSKSDKIGETIEKEIINIIKENGIESDVNLFLTEADNFLNKSRSLSATSLFGGDTSYTMSDLIHIQKMANSVKENKAAHTNASNNLNAQQAWNDVAISTNGGLYVLTENGLQVVDPAEYAKMDKSKVQALTNSQLMGLRESRPELAFATHYLYDMSGAIGFKTITDQLIGTIKDFGEKTRTEYVKNNGPISQSAWDGMQILIGNDPEGYYKATTKSERENVDSAISYLWDLLGKTGQARLKAEIAASGGNPNNPSDRYELILRALEHHTNFSQEVAFDKTATEYDPDGDGKGTKSSESLTEGTLPIEVARGNLTETTAYMSPVAQRVSDKAMMAFKAWNAGQLQDKQGDILHANNLQDLLPKVYQAKSADTSTVVFGNQLLTNAQVGSVVWDGSSLATRVALPRKFVNGKQVPDFELMQKLNELNAWISDTPGVTSLDVHEKMKGLASEGVYFDESTNSYAIDPSRIGFFLSFAGYGSTDLLDIKDESKPFLYKLTRNEGREIKTQFNNLVQFGDLTPSRKDKQKNNYGSSEGNDFYYGNIYIPIVDPMQAVITTKDQYYSKNNFMDSVKINELGQQILHNSQNTNWKTSF